MKSKEETFQHKPGCISWIIQSRVTPGREICCSTHSGGVCGRVQQYQAEFIVFWLSCTSRPTSPPLELEASCKCKYCHPVYPASSHHPPNSLPFFILSRGYTTVSYQCFVFWPYQTRKKWKWKPRCVYRRHDPWGYQNKTPHSLRGVKYSDLGLSSREFHFEIFCFNT